MGIILVVGLGQFGVSAAEELYELGAEVAVLDGDAKKVDRIRSKCAMSAVVDATNQDALEKLIPEAVDAVVIDIGGKENPFLNILLAKFYHSKMIPKIVALAYSSQHAEILKIVGATDVVEPEREAAKRVARTLFRRGIASFLPVSDHFAIADIKPPKSFIGKKVGDLEIRKNHGVALVGFKIANEDEKSEYKFPEADDTILANFMLVVVGPQKKILQLG